MVDVEKNGVKNATLVRSRYRDANNREQVMHRIQEKKVIDLLLNHAKITDKIVTYQDRQKAQELIV